MRRLWTLGRLDYYYRQYMLLVVVVVVVVATLRLLATSVEYGRNVCTNDVVRTLLCHYAFPTCVDRKSDSVATSRSDISATSRARQRRPNVTRLCREDCETLQRNVCREPFNMLRERQLTGIT